MSDGHTTVADDTGHDSNADLINMAEEIGTAVATGLVPFLGQAVNIYDTVECLITLHNSSDAESTAEAKFDLVLALVGWIPGAGGGVKKTIRIVNKNPDRYAPILFDVLRMICAKLGIHTSPEVLLQKLFDAAGLKSLLGTVQSAIEDSWAYEKLPQEGQLALAGAMTTVRAELPAMVMLVTKKLTKWKSKQRNNAARQAGMEKKTPTDTKPATNDATVAKTGDNTPTPAQSNGTANAQLGATALDEITNSITGIVGEHITDYFLYEEYGWGKDWSEHDRGQDGGWQARPGKTSPGKLNEETKLNKLFADKAHGVGIDGVWKVQLGDPHNNAKPYAIIESKASAVSSAPTNSSRKPGIRSKLLDNAKRIKESTLPKSDDLLEPDTKGGASSAGTGKGGGKPPGKAGASGKSPGGKHANAKSPPPAGGKNSSAERPVVQMSQVWIENNIRRAVRNQEVSYEIASHGIRVYSRHLFYTPFYLPSSAAHLKALHEGNRAAHEKHADHQIPSTHRHDEHEVKAAVNRKHVKLGLPVEP